MHTGGLYGSKLTQTLLDPGHLFRDPIGSNHFAQYITDLALVHVQEKGNLRPVYFMDSAQIMTKNAVLRSNVYLVRYNILFSPILLYKINVSDVYFYFLLLSLVFCLLFL